MSVAPFLAAVLELKMRVDSVQWLDEHYRQKTNGRQSHLLEGAYILIFEASCAYSKISPLPKSGPCLLAEKRGEGLIFGKIWNIQAINCGFSNIIVENIHPTPIPLVEV